uniref:Uncharacterized protein n=1 Tax=Mycena chlorophos TaxID=658473 RepID=A0ABQ0KV71_MYCCL|nr:predicted protein [Mycena chlorophos]
MGAELKKIDGERGLSSLAALPRITPSRPAVDMSLSTTNGAHSGDSSRLPTTQSLPVNLRASRPSSPSKLRQPNKPTRQARQEAGRILLDKDGKRFCGKWLNILSNGRQSRVAGHGK